MMSKSKAKSKQKNSETDKGTFEVGNKLIESNHGDITLQQGELLRLAIYYSRENESGFEPNRPVVIRVDDFAKRFGIKSKDGLYTQLRSSALSLLGKAFTRDEVIDNDMAHIKTNWVREVICFDGSGEIRILFEELLKEHIWRLHKLNAYTRLSLTSYKGISTNYAARLYEILAKWRAAKKCSYTLEEMVEMLNINKSERTTHILNRILRPNLAKVNAATDITAQMEVVRRGKNIHSFDFVVVEKEPQPLFSGKPKAPPKEFKDIIAKRLWDEQRIDLNKTTEQRSLNDWSQWLDSADAKKRAKQIEVKQ